MIECAPARSALVEKDAVPPVSAFDPRTVAPSRKLTLPVGVPAAEVTVAVNVTDCPWVEGLRLETSVVDVPAGLTVCGQAADAAPRKLPSPEYVAVIEWTPAARVEVVNVAVPLVRVAVPRLAAPSRKVTVPVGVPAPGATALTVAVKVTDWPNVDGLVEEATVVVELAWLTVWVIDADVLVVKLASPP